MGEVEREVVEDAFAIGDALGLIALEGEFVEVAAGELAERSEPVRLVFHGCLTEPRSFREDDGRVKRERAHAAPSFCQS
jgi:hypothetical protein